MADRLATQTLSTFLAAVLAKKYTNPSSDIITVLAGLDHIDAVFTDFVGSLDYIIRNGKSCECWFRVARVDLAGLIQAVVMCLKEEGLTVRLQAEIRRKAVEVALAITSGAYQTSLLTYLIQRDMFPSVMKVCMATSPPGGDEPV